MPVKGGDDQPPAVVLSFNKGEYETDDEGNVYVTFEDASVFTPFINRLIIDGVSVLGGTA